MSEPNLFAVVMAGGSGTRFWPASRKHLPKQFLPIAGPKAMIAQTVDRLDGLIPPERILVVCGRNHVDLVKETAPEIPAENVLAEPIARNTAPCVAWAALEIQRRDPEAIQVVLPADHAIEPVDAFQVSLRAAAEATTKGTLVTLGIQPTYPATGYGYIEAGERASDDTTVRSVQRFVEKPDRWRAQEFVDSHRFFWNGGIFLWTTDTIVQAFRDYLPEVVEKLEGGGEIEDVYPTLPAQSVDVAIMEPAAEAGKVRLVPIEYRWSDVGSWVALPDVHGSDEAGNCVVGGTTLVADDVKNCIVWGEDGTLTAAIGVEDLMIVRAGNAVLICPRDRAEDVRRIVAEIDREHPDFA